MSSYFDRLIQSYGPAPPGPAAQMPWTTEVAAELETAVSAADLATGCPKEDAPPAPAPTVAPAEWQDPAPVPGSQADVDQDPINSVMPPADDPAGVERLTERIIERRIEENAAPATKPSQVLAPGPTEQIVEMQDRHETHVYIAETHIHAVPDSPAGTEAGPAVMPVEPAPEDTLQITEETDDRDTALAKLEAHLAKTFAGLQASHQQTPVTIIEAADFEPDGTDLQPSAETDVIREVSREIVKEIHHHHETRIEAAPRTAPRSAEEASRIGRIRFASAWDRSGGAW